MELGGKLDLIHGAQNKRAQSMCSLHLRARQ